MMKKRRTIIISFLLLATLVMGVGYAAVADTLNITGRASFRPASLVAGEVASAIKFDKTFGTNGATPHLSFDDDITHVTASVVEDNEAALTLVINDTTTLEDYTVAVTYKIMYDIGTGDAAAYPDVTPAVTSTLRNAGVDVEGFTIDTVLTDSETPGAGTAVSTLQPGQVAYAHVTITYETPATVPTAVVAGNIAITLNFSTPDA